MNEFQVTGFPDGTTFYPMSTMADDNLFLGILFDGSIQFESTTSSTTPYQVSIRLDGTEVSNSGTITSGIVAATGIPIEHRTSTGYFTVHILSDDNITFQSLKWQLSKYVQPNYLVPGTMHTPDYTSTNSSYTPNGSTEVSSTGNYRQQTTSNLGATTSCPTCTTYISAILLSATPSAPNAASCSEGNDGTLENRVYVLYTTAWFTTNAAGKNVVLSAFSLTDNEIINSSDSAYTIHPDSIDTAGTTVFRNSSDGNYMIKDTSTEGTAKLLFVKSGVYGTTTLCGGGAGQNN